MDENTIMSLVGSLGFPIVCCYFMWRYINTTLKEFTSMMNKNNEQIARLCDKIDLIIMGATDIKKGKGKADGKQ